VRDQEANDTAAEFVRQRIAELVEDPRVAEDLMPRGYAFGTKRPCLDTGYYATFNRPNVELVNLRRTPIEQITPTGVRTTEREYPLDTLVFATGYDAMTGPLLAMDICGRDGLTLAEKWAAGPISYLGLAVAGFPNMFTLTGPGSPSVLSNVVISIEQHVDWVADVLAHLERTDRHVVEATDVAEKEWTDHVQQVSRATLYPQTDSWLMGANIPGKPRVFLPTSAGSGPTASTASRWPPTGTAASPWDPRPARPPLPPDHQHRAPCATEQRGSHE
jgi:cation diffusion facilitator CzcD-associated flavoprotein CzcO